MRKAKKKVQLPKLDSFLCLSHTQRHPARRVFFKVLVFGKAVQEDSIIYIIKAAWRLAKNLFDLSNVLVDNGIDYKASP